LYLCDPTNLAAECKGVLTLYLDGVAHGTAEHPLDAADAPWVYGQADPPLPLRWVFERPSVP
ncbi:hypothetical protein L0Y59_03250, partial [Candidatus Uhrbacteria bacterium]|nr:hypothetical protein [Candidatus Uhrbacteria bacterium]